MQAGAQRSTFLSLMAWTAEQSNEVFENYWQIGGAPRPFDGSLVDVHRARYQGSYFLTAGCPRCGSRLRMGREDDTRRQDFRQWTDQEKQRLVEDYFQQRAGDYPVCGASVHMQSVPTLDANHIMLLCDRCGNSGALTVPRR